jgi:diguanylate cyclase (GGDEF)-like protein
MSDIYNKLATSTASIKNMTAPSLKNRLKISIILIILPLIILAAIGFFFFQKSTQAFNVAIEEIVSDVIPVTELKDKIQNTVIPFNRYLENHEIDEKEKFIRLSNEIKQALVDPIKLKQKNHSLSNDIYRTAYMSWRNAHRVAMKIFEQEQNRRRISHQLLQGYYQYVIETTLALDTLHLAMQDRVKIRFQKAKALKLDALLLISFVALMVYITTVSTVIFLNRSIVNPISKLENWASTFSRKADVEPLELNSYREFEYIASTYNKLAQMLKDDQAILEELSLKDDLTELANKRYIIDRIKDEHNRHLRYNTRYSLMLIDIDHLGSINQNYGEQVCETTLVQIARMLEDAIRPTDLLARYGKDEFVILLPEVEFHGANITAERIRNSIAEYVFKVDDFKFGVTVSIGYSIVHENQQLSSLLKCIDSALQQAKLAGRNQVQFCDQEALKSIKFKSKYFLDQDFS